MPRQFYVKCVINGKTINNSTHGCREAAAGNMRSMYRDHLLYQQHNHRTTSRSTPQYGNDSFYYIAAYEAEVPTLLEFTTTFACATALDIFTPFLDEVAALYPGITYTLTEKPKEGLMPRSIVITITGDYQVVLCWWWMVLVARIVITIMPTATNVAGLIAATDTFNRDIWYSSSDKTNALAAWGRVREQIHLGALSFWIAAGPASLLSGVPAFHTAQRDLANRRAQDEHMVEAHKKFDMLSKTRAAERARYLETARSRLTAKLEL